MKFSVCFLSILYKKFSEKYLRKMNFQYVAYYTAEICQNSHSLQFFKMLISKSITINSQLKNTFVDVL